MPIEISCSNCQAILRVADEHAGKSARCPQCSTVIPIPLTPLPDEQSAASNWQGQPAEQPGASDNPYSTPATPTSNPYAAPTTKPGMGHGWEAHRGPTILVLGIVSLVCCFFAAIPAIIMANEDLRKMDQGVMNPDGRALTTAGKIIGIVSLIMNAVVIVIQILFVFVGAVAPGF